MLAKLKKWLLKKPKRSERAIDRAVRLKKDIIISYISESGVFSQRLVSSLSIRKSKAGNELVTGFCHLRGEFRSFRVDRIVEMEVIE